MLRWVITVYSTRSVVIPRFYKHFQVYKNTGQTLLLNFAITIALFSCVMLVYTLRYERLLLVIDGCRPVWHRLYGSSYCLLSI